MASVVLVANPRAGGGRALGAATAARDRLTDMGVTAELAVPASAAEISTVVSRARDISTDAVIACGGDGTAHQVLQQVQPTGLPLGILPLGTGNDIARSLAIPVGDMDAWVTLTTDLLRAQRTRTVDLARIDTPGASAWSLAVTSIGFDSAVNERADRMQRVSGTPRYVLAVLGELAQLRSHPVEMTADGARVQGDTTLVAIGNGPTYGGGMRICPGALLDDGLLDVTWVEAARRRTILRVFPRIFSGRHVDHPMVRTLRAREVRIDAPTAVAYSDGERIGPASLTVTAVPGALRVLAR